VELAGAGDVSEGRPLCVGWLHSLASALSSGLAEDYAARDRPVTVLVEPALAR
jgi:hypothetical protein